MARTISNANYQQLSLLALSASSLIVLLAIIQYEVINTRAQFVLASAFQPEYQLRQLNSNNNNNNNNGFSPGPSYNQLYDENTDDEDSISFNQILLPPSLVNEYPQQQQQQTGRQQQFASLNDDEGNNYIVSLNEPGNLIQVQDDSVVEQEGDDHQSKTANREEIYILEDKDYPKSVYEKLPNDVGQVSGIATLPSGDVAIFHRSSREWKADTFAENFSIPVGERENLIQNDTIMVIDRDNGSAVMTFGSQLFYMPHSLASDPSGNLWVSDVARHQVMRLPTSSLQTDYVEASGEKTKRLLAPSSGNVSSTNQIWPDIILGEAFVPGNDDKHFCQPSELVVSSDGRLVFIADGYCNQRIMVFSGNGGKFIRSFGSEHGMNVVHSLTLIEERNLICAADRENGRILCFRAGLDGDLSNIGQLILTVNYPLGRVFAIVALGADHMLVSSNQVGTSRYDLATLNPFASELKQTWASSDLLFPHSLAKTNDGQNVYATDMSREAYKKIFKFYVIYRKF